MHPCWKGWRRLVARLGSGGGRGERACTSKGWRVGVLFEMSGLVCKLCSTMPLPWGQVMSQTTLDAECYIRLVSGRETVTRQHTLWQNPDQNSPQE